MSVTVECLGGRLVKITQGHSLHSPCVFSIFKHGPHWLLSTSASRCCICAAVGRSRSWRDQGLKGRVKAQLSLEPVSVKTYSGIIEFRWAATLFLVSRVWVIIQAAGLGALVFNS